MKNQQSLAGISFFVLQGRPLGQINCRQGSGGASPSGVRGSAPMGGLGGNAPWWGGLGGSAPRENFEFFEL